MMKFNKQKKSSNPGHSFNESDSKTFCKKSNYNNDLEGVN